MDLIIKVLALVAAAFLLVVVNLWFVRSALDGFRSRTLPNTIAPIHVLGVEDKDGRAGQALASMLLARMGRIRDEVAATVEQLSQPLGDSSSIRPQDLRSAPAIDLPSGLLEPLNLEMKVAGVEFGGILNWLYRTMTSDNALLLTLQNGTGQAVVSGAWNDGRDTLWVEVRGDADKPVPQDRIIKSVAYALMQRQVVHRVPEVSALSASEFETLLATLAEAASTHRQAALGRAAENDFAILSDQMEILIARTPRWKELLHFSARLAERGGKVERALTRYKETLAHLDKNSVLREPINKRVKTLTDRLIASALPPTTVAVATSAVDPDPRSIGGRPSVGEGIGKAQWPLFMLGVTRADMAHPVRIAVLGGLPAEGTLPAEQFDVVGPPPSGEKPDPMMANYVRTVVQAVLLVAPKARFVFARSGATGGMASEAQVLAEVAALAQAKPDVALLTLGPLTGTAFAQLFERLVAQNVVVVLPAGNDADRDVPKFGNRLDEQVLVVSSVSQRGTPSAFTQRGEQTLWAPGEKIPVLSVDKSVKTGDGTSYAAALAAGVVARLLGEFPKVDTRTLRATLATTAQPQTNGGPQVINLARAREKLLKP